MQIIQEALTLNNLVQDVSGAIVNINVFTLRLGKQLVWLGDRDQLQIEALDQIKFRSFCNLCSARQLDRSCEPSPARSLLVSG